MARAPLSARTPLDVLWPATRRPLIVAGLAAAIVVGSAATAWKSPTPSAPSIESEQEKRADQLAIAARRLIGTRTLAGYTEAADLARAAVARDPQSAPALTELAVALVLPKWWKEQQEPGAAARLQHEALSYLDRALAVDPDLPRALAAKGMVLHNEEGARLIERAVATDPDDVDIWRWAANARHRRNDFAGAFAAHARAASLDPTSRQMAGTYVQYALFMGRADLAQAAIARFARAGDPAAVRVLRIYTTMYSGRLGEAATLSVFVLRDGGADPSVPIQRLIFLARAVGDRSAMQELASRFPSLGTSYAPFLDPSHAVARVQSEKSSMFDKILAETEARSLLRLGKQQLLLAAADAHGGAMSQLWRGSTDEEPFSLGAGLVLALRQTGREPEAQALLSTLNASLFSATRLGVINHSYRIAAMRLACLDGDANRAATELAKAIDEGWRGQGSWTEVDPIDDPVCVGVARDARFAAQRARRAMLVAAERPAVHRATTAAIAWLDANPLPQPQDPPR
jgi:tetratricopeptide (TPR) repeat protein